MNSTDFQDNKLSNDDLQWFSQIFSQCYEDLVNYARTIVYYKDCAEDVVQEAFIIGIQKKSCFERKLKSGRLALSHSSKCCQK